MNAFHKALKCPLKCMLGDGRMPYYCLAREIFLYVRNSKDAPDPSCSPCPLYIQFA